MDRGGWVRVLQHYIELTIFLVLSFLLASESAISLGQCNTDQYNGILEGMNYKTTLIVICNSCQGVLASLFLKFADTIMKKFSSNIATLVTGLLSAIFFSQQLTSNFFIAFAMVSVALHQFYNLKPGYAVPTRKNISPIPSGGDLA